MSILTHYELTTQKINTLLDDINKDRNNLFNTVKNPKEDDKENQLNVHRLSVLDTITRSLIKYKNILYKIDNKKD